MNPALNVRLCTRRARNVIGSSPVSTTHTLLLPIPFTGGGGGGVAISFNARIRAVFPRGNPISPPSMKESRNLWPHLHEAAYISSFRGIERRRRTKEKRRKKKKRLDRWKKRALGGRLIRRGVHWTVSKVILRFLTFRDARGLVVWFYFRIFCLLNRICAQY